MTDKDKKYYSENRDKIIKRVKEWTILNKDRKLENASKRRHDKILVISEIKESKPCKDCRKMVPLLHDGF